jgi:type I restriction enzyme R subunit
MPGLAKFVTDNILDKPAEFWNMDKISQEHKLKRKLDIIEYLQVLFGKRPRFKTNDEVIDSFFERFYQSDKADTAKMYELRSLFFAYILNPDIRRIIDNKEYPSLEVQSGLSLNDLEKLGKKQIKDTISFIKNNQIIQNFNQSA